MRASEQHPKWCFSDEAALHQLVLYQGDFSAFEEYLLGARKLDMVALLVDKFIEKGQHISDLKEFFLDVVKLGTADVSGNCTELRVNDF